MDSLALTLVLVSLAVYSQAKALCNLPFLCLDCHTLQVCSPHAMSWDNTTIVDCSQTDLPYCDSTLNSCSATPSATCIPVDSFPCLSDGYFPDTTDCRTFHLCVDLVPTVYRCDPSLPSNYGYDVVLHRCVPSPTCGFVCADKSGVKVPHSSDKNLFAFCYNGSALLQDRCPANYELDEDSQQCAAVCKAEGLLADVDRCDWFFRCVEQNGGYLRKHEQCPEAQGFNPLTFRCEADLASCGDSSKAVDPFHKNTP